MVDEEEDTADVGGGRVVAEERGVGLAEPDGCGIGIAPWTDISREARPHRRAPCVHDGEYRGLIVPATFGA